MIDKVIINSTQKIDFWETRLEKEIKRIDRMRKWCEAVWKHNFVKEERQYYAEDYTRQHIEIEICSICRLVKI